MDDIDEQDFKKFEKTFDGISYYMIKQQPEMLTLVHSCSTTPQKLSVIVFHKY